MQSKNWAARAKENARGVIWSYNSMLTIVKGAELLHFALVDPAAVDSEVGGPRCSCCFRRQRSAEGAAASRHHYGGTLSQQ